MVVDGAATTCARDARRRLGLTGLDVSRIGLGLAAVGRPAYMALGRHADLGVDRSIPLMERRCHALLDAAYELDVSYIDVARSYGHAEQFLANWWNRRGLPRTALTVGSKWGYAYTGGWQLDAPVHEVKHLSAQTLHRQLAESREILGPTMSLYQIHSATVESGVLEDVSVLTALAQLRDTGVAVGVTVTGPRQRDVIRGALDVHLDGVRLFQCVQATWNLLEPSAGPALAEASADGRGVIVKEVLANGRLTNRHAGPELAGLYAHAAARDVSIEMLAISAALAQPWADVVLSGAVTRQQLEGQMSAMSSTVPPVLADDLAEPPSEYWRRRAQIAWS